MKLTPYPKKANYSVLEMHIFNAMPKDGRKVDSRFLATARNDMGKWKVRNPLNIITVTMNSLIDKVKANKEDFVIKKDGKRPGHPEVEYWVEAR